METTGLHQHSEHKMATSSFEDRKIGNTCTEIVCITVVKKLSKQSNRDLDISEKKVWFSLA